MIDLNALLVPEAQLPTQLRAILAARMIQKYLAQGCKPETIAYLLNEQKILTTTGKVWTAYNVNQQLYRMKNKPEKTKYALTLDWGHIYA